MKVVYSKPLTCIWSLQLLRSWLNMQSKISADCNKVESGQKFLNENWCLCYSWWIIEVVFWYLMYTYRSFSVALSRWANDSMIAHLKKTIQWKHNFHSFYIPPLLPLLFLLWEQGLPLLMTMSSPFHVVYAYAFGYLGSLVFYISDSRSWFRTLTVYHYCIVIFSHIDLLLWSLIGR